MKSTQISLQNDIYNFEIQTFQGLQQYTKCLSPKCSASPIMVAPILKWEFANGTAPGAPEHNKDIRTCPDHVLR